jgi:hypothetical protein
MGPNMLREATQSKARILFFLQNTYVTSTCQTKFPKIEWKHITYYIYHLFDEKFVNFKRLFNVNLLYNINLAYCVLMFGKIQVGTRNNKYSLINYVFMICKFALKVIIWQLSMQFSKEGINQPYKEAYKET